MPELTFVSSAIAAGALISFGALLMSRVLGFHAVIAPPGVAAPPTAQEAFRDGWTRRSRAARAWLAVRIARAGWNETPERLAALSVILASVLGAVGLCTVFFAQAGTAASIALLGCISGFGAVGIALRSAITRRRRRLTRELAPLLELFVLELGGGGSAMSALGTVTMQIEGELASELRRHLIAAQVTGSASFETRLRDHAERLQIPALASLATILTASREYGTGVTEGVRALAADLRRAQRRELIAHSRRALNHVLFPAAIGVLLPFLAILLFPAISALQSNLR